MSTRALPVGWQWRTLGDVTEPKIDQGGPTRPEFVYVDISSIDSAAKCVVAPQNHPASEAPSRARQRLRAGDVVVSMTRPNLNAVAQIPNELDGSIGSTGFHVLRAKGVEASWLRYAVQTPDFVLAMTGQVQGALYPAVRPKDIRAFCLPVPPAEQQLRIVAAIEEQLSRLAAGTAALERLQSHLRRYRAAVLKAACEGSLPEACPAVRGQAADSSKGLGALPQGWEWVPLPELGELNRGKSKHRPRDDARLYGGAYPFIQTGDVKASRGTISTHSQTYSELGLRQSRLWPAGTLCITIAANIADTGILSFPACFPDSVVGFLANELRASARYVEFFLRTAKSDLARYAPATAQKNINLETLRALLVPLPPRPVQDRIVGAVNARFEAVERTEAAVAAGVRRAHRLRASILRTAFAGALPTLHPLSTSHD